MPHFMAFKPECDLRPFSAQIQPGTVLYLNNDGAARALRLGTDLEVGALGHPCVVVSPPQDYDFVRILLLTSFSGKLIHDHIKKSYWQEYLPIEPTPDHPGYPGLRLRMIGAPNSVGGYVNIIDRYWVPWKMLTKWVVGGSIDQVYFDDASIELVLHFMEWATYDATNEPAFKSPEPDAAKKDTYQMRLVGLDENSVELMESSKNVMDKCGRLLRKSARIAASVALRRQSRQESLNTVQRSHAHLTARTTPASSSESVMARTQPAPLPSQAAYSADIIDSMEHQLESQQRLNSALLSFTVAITVLVVVLALSKAHDKPA